MSSSATPTVETAAVYIPKSSLQSAGIAGLQAGGVGVLVSAVQNALGHHNRGAAGIFTRTGGTIGFFAAMGATFAFTDAATANIREKNDAINGAAGGCAAGFLYGVRTRSLPVAFASCAIVGTIMGTFDAAGRSLTGEEDQTRLSRDGKGEKRRKFFKEPKTPNPQTEGATTEQ